MGPNTAGCGRRQGSALRFARWRGANAALTAVLAGQDNPRIRAKAKRKIGLLGTDHQKERATYTKSRTLPRGGGSPHATVVEFVSVKASNFSKAQ
jgi:hypothetical protein